MVAGFAFLFIKVINLVVTKGIAYDKNEGRMRQKTDRMEHSKNQFCMSLLNLTRQAAPRHRTPGIYFCGEQAALSKPDIPEIISLITS
jgi:hypothetical protein